MTDYTRRPLFRKGSTSVKPSYWIGSRDVLRLPEDAILAEDGDPILTEFSQFLLTES